MAIVVLVLWLFTAGAGFYLLVTSNLGRARPAATTPAATTPAGEPATAPGPPDRGTARMTIRACAHAGVQDPPRPAARQRGHGDLRPGRPDRPHPEPLRAQKSGQCTRPPTRNRGSRATTEPGSVGVVSSMI